MKVPITTSPIKFLVTITILITTVYTLLLKQNSPNSDLAMARSFVLWLHGLGDSGPANEPIKTLFTSPEFRNTVWSFPSAPSNPVTCNYGAVMPSWFDLHEIPVTARSEGQTLGGVRMWPHGVSVHHPKWFIKKASTFQINDSPKDEKSLLKTVKNVHAMIDKELAMGTNPKNVFVCGFSQGGALTLASVLLYPRTLGGGAVFSGWVPFNSSATEKFHPDAKKTPILWSHGIADKTVLFEAGQAGPPFLEQAGITCEFKAYPGLGHSISNSELQYLEVFYNQGLCMLFTFKIWMEMSASVFIYLFSLAQRRLV